MIIIPIKFLVTIESTQEKAIIPKGSFLEIMNWKQALEIEDSN
jgi:hypothetical protein